MGGLMLGVGLLFFIIIWLVCTTVGLNDFPVALQAVLAFLAGGAVVYKFLSNRIA